MKATKPMRLMPLFLVLILAGLCFSFNYYPPDDNDPSDSMTVSVISTCDGNTVSVTGNDGNISGAHVSVKEVPSANPVATGDTDAGGLFVFEGCGKKVDVKVTNPDFFSETVTLELIGCGQCVPQPACLDDTQCPAEQACAQGECAAVVCQCGAVENHTCVEYECCDDSACPLTQACADNSCQDVPSGGCGIVANHTFIAYECGTEGCPLCQEGYECIGNKCILSEVACPSSGVVGTTGVCNATENGLPCANCDYVITDPAGRNATGLTDGNGSFSLPLSQQGKYLVALLKDGRAVRIIEITSMPRASGDTGTPTAASTDLMPVMFGILLLLLLAAAIYIWRGRAAKKRGI